MAESGGRAPVSAAEVTEVRARLRRASPDARRDAVDTLRSWQHAELAPDAGLAALRAATVGYPWVAEVPDDVGELLVAALWSDPLLVPVGELERAYVFCAERARRAILATLARRADRESLDVVGHLIGPDGPVQLLPVPTTDLLRPLLDVPGVERLAPALLAIARRRGWAGHASDLLGEMVTRGLLGDADREAVTAGLAEIVWTTVDTCDRGVTGGGEALVRVERERLGTLLPVLARMPGEVPSAALRRTLASADPRVSATAALGLLRRGEPVGADRLDLVARDAEARSILLRGLVELGMGCELAPERRSEVSVAEAEVVRWLASASELGAAPDEVEHRGVVPAPATWGRGAVHVFAFRVRPPHWCAGRNWMLAAVGPFEDGDDGVPRPAPGYAAHSLYAPEDGDELVRHVLEISEAVEESSGEEAA